MSGRHHQRYSAHRNVKGRSFICNYPAAERVSVVGDFNNWKPDSDPMAKGSDGVRLRGRALR